MRIGWIPALGSVHQLTNEAGEITLAKSYLPYGEAISGAGGAASSYGYTGEAVDEYTNLVFLQARWYAPTLNLRSVSIALTPL